MKTPAHHFVALILSVIVIAALLPPAAFCGVNKPTIATGMLFPEFSLSTPVDPAACNYLGLVNGAQTFTASQIDSSVLLVEFTTVRLKNIITT